jgi:DNA-binding beta-propeller fold protein YncE
MHRIMCLAILPIVLLTAPVPAASASDEQPGIRGTFWVTDRQNDRVAVYDATSATLLGVFNTELVPDPAVADEPNDVAIAAGKAYVTNEASGTISVFDANAHTLLTRLAAGPKPHHAAASQSGRLVAYGAYGTNEVGIIDTRTETIRRLRASNRPGTVLTHAALFAANGRTVYAANEIKSGSTHLPGTVSEIDVATGAIRCEIEVGRRPSEVAVARNGPIGVVSVRNEHLLKEVDFRACRLTGRSVDLGEEVDTLNLAPDARNVTIGLRGPTPLPARVALVDLVSFTDVRYSTIPGGTLTGHQWTSPNRRYTYVAFEGANAGLAVIDHVNGTVTTLTPIGGRPHGIAHTRLR